jgi:hypothetical protein
LYHLGFLFSANKGITYSSYLAVDHRDGLLLDQQDIQSGQVTVSSGNILSGPNSTFQSSSSSCPGVTFISFTAACKLVVGSLKKEKGIYFLRKNIVLLYMKYLLNFDRLECFTTGASKFANSFRK